LKKKPRFAGMKMAAMLYGLKSLMQLTALRNKQFKAKMSERNWVMQFRTADSSVGRYYHFHDGKILSGRGTHKKPDFTFIWRDAGTGCRIMLHVSSRVIMKSLKNEDLKLKGKAEGIAWFVQLLRMMKIIRK
jgi:hypothetical protein